MDILSYIICGMLLISVPVNPNQRVSCLAWSGLWRISGAFADIKLRKSHGIYQISRGAEATFLKWLAFMCVRKCFCFEIPGVERPG